MNAPTSGGLTKTFIGAVGESPDTASAEARFRATFGYVPADPYAVTLTITTQTGPRVWEFGRELLAEGLGCAPAVAGSGDVRIRRETTVNFQEIRDEVYIGLRAPTGSADLWFPAAPVAAFLDATFHLVAAGDETSRIQWDRELHDLIGGKP